MANRSNVESGSFSEAQGENLPVAFLSENEVAFMQLLNSLLQNSDSVSISSDNNVFIKRKVTDEEKSANR